jgi:hypothetical protein
VNPGMRSALFHLVTGVSNEENMKSIYSLGDYSYFSESAYKMDGWENRYWGDNISKLKSIK